MALSPGQTGTADSIDADYFTQDESDFPARVHIHLDAIDGVARDAVDATAGSAGLLLGHVEPGDRPVVWIDQYHRVLNDHDLQAFEDAANFISRDSKLAVVGFYRIQTCPGFQLTEVDREIAHRYFNDNSDVILLVEALNHQISALFSTGEKAGQPFAFQGRTAVDTRDNDTRDNDIQPDTARTSPPERVGAERPRRLVPDFAQAEPPKPVFRELPALTRANDPIPEQTRFRRMWLPLLAAVVLTGVALAFLFYSPGGSHEASPTAAAPIRPLGLYVDPAGDNWRVSWNPSGTAFQGARGVSLFVRDGEDQNRIDLAPNDLRSGTYQYQPKGQDATFRLEVAEADGHISAESFRFIKGAPAPSLPAAAAKAEPSAPANTPRAVRKVAPVVAAGIRPRIHGSIPIDVRVVVNAKGRVASAVPVSSHSGLQSYLAERAVAAARKWRFEAGSPGSQTIHFVFDK
ncbi:MAG: hypothetical protein ABJC09_13030 [Terriglobia bacterium]